MSKIFTAESSHLAKIREPDGISYKWYLCEWEMLLIKSHNVSKMMCSVKSAIGGFRWINGRTFYIWWSIVVFSSWQAYALIAQADRHQTSLTHKAPPEGTGSVLTS